MKANISVNPKVLFQSLFNPCVKLKNVGKGLLMANCSESKKILKMYKGAHWLLESDYDGFLRFVSNYGCSIEVED